MDLAPQHGVLLTPESIGSQQIDDDCSTSAHARERNAKNKEAELWIRIWIVLESEQLGNDYTEEGQCKGGSKVAQVGTFERCTGRLSASIFDPLIF